MRNIHAFLCLLLTLQQINAQQDLLDKGKDTLLVAEPPYFSIERIEVLPDILPPVEVNASDGTYGDWIEIKWAHKEPGIQYKVFRSENAKSSNPQPISKWIKSNAFADQEKKLEPGKKYYYWVIAGRNSQDISKLSDSDDGFTRGYAHPNSSSKDSSKKRKKDK